MLFYVLHEFLKSFDGERPEQVQREWFQTVDEVLNACAREIRCGDKRSMEENRKRVFKVSRVDAHDVDLHLCCFTAVAAAWMFTCCRYFTHI